MTTTSLAIEDGIKMKVVRSSGMHDEISRTNAGHIESKRKRKRKRKRIRKCLQIVPCFSLLIICWLIIHFQKLHQNQLQLLEEEIEARNENRNFNDHEAKKAKDEGYSKTIITRIDGVGRIDKYPFNGLADVARPTSDSQTAFFWQIPKTGGNSNIIVSSR